MRNLKGTSFSVSEQLPPETNERRSHLMPKFKEAKSARMPVKWNMDKLTINGVTYAQHKDQADFANALPADSINEIKHTDIHQERGSSFQAHIVKIDDKAQVVPTLHKLYKNHNVAKATHNIYAYRIENRSSLIENSCDDGEFGAGHRLLKLLKDSCEKNVMIVVTRWYGGIQMGPQRFRCILDVASKALNLNK